MIVLVVLLVGTVVVSLGLIVDMYRRDVPIQGVWALTTMLIGGLFASAVGGINSSD